MQSFYYYDDSRNKKRMWKGWTLENADISFFSMIAGAGTVVYEVFWSFKPMNNLLSISLTHEIGSPGPELLQAFSPRVSDPGILVGLGTESRNFENPGFIADPYFIIQTRNLFKMYRTFFLLIKFFHIVSKTPGYMYSGIG